MIVANYLVMTVADDRGDVTIAVRIFPAVTTVADALVEAAATDLVVKVVAHAILVAKAAVNHPLGDGC